jgi:predicted MFS family arabinose efflux permease
LLSLIGVFDIVGTLASGWLTDKVDPRRLLFAYYGLRGVSLIFLEPLLSAGHAPLVLFIAFYGLDWVATVPPTIALCRRLCGEQWATVAYGWVYVGHQVGAALAAWGAAKIRDVTGSYQLAWLIAGVCCMVAALSVQGLGEHGPGEGVLVGPTADPVSAGAAATK